MIPATQSLRVSLSGETIALIGASGFRSLALACELGNQELLRKLIIVDNSNQFVIAFKNNAAIARLSEAQKLYADIQLPNTF